MTAINGGRSKVPRHAWSAGRAGQERRAANNSQPSPTGTTHGSAPGLLGLTGFISMIYNDVKEGGEDATFTRPDYSLKHNTHTAHTAIHTYQRS